MRLTRMWKIMHIEEDVIHLVWRPRLDNILRDLHNFSHRTKAKFNNCLLFIQEAYIWSYLFVDFLQNFGLFVGTVSGYKLMLYLADAAQKVNNVHRAIFVPYSCMSSVQF